LEDILGHNLATLAKAIKEVMSEELLA